ncbi:MAG: hypothetical protein JXB85_01380 [Anaerolineales bacterium]|nr:hypothetical protein [Anaerolineales bacterium]
MTWKPVPGDLMTRWAKAVLPELPWPEYPRPQMARPEWLNLNGLWNYAVTLIGERGPLLEPLFGGESRDGMAAREEDPVSPLFLRDRGTILVPYPIESALSGVKRQLQPDERLWYWRTFTIPGEWHGKRILLHFGAVDWETVVWVNQAQVGLHRGGYLPFSFEVTPFLREGGNEIVVAVWDPSDTHWQQRGKQVLDPKGIWYTPASGIWQTVWLEPVPAAYIAGLRVTPNLDKEAVHVAVDLRPGIRHTFGMPPPAGNEQQFLEGTEIIPERADASGAARLPPVRVRVYDSGKLVADQQMEMGSKGLTLAIPAPKTWSPDDPHLYNLVVETDDDLVESYFGMRKFSLGTDSLGRTRLCLNDRPLFQFGPLDQGYWPDGLYTPPTDAAMRADLEAIKGLGCNMLRKHIKVEPARYYYYCDQMGLIVWQDMINGGRSQSELEAILSLVFPSSRRDDRSYWRFGRSDPESREDFHRELRALVDHLYHFACIGVWVTFNEGWGQFDSVSISQWLKSYDPSRLVDHASGWFEQGGGDFRSRHIYSLALKPEPMESRRAIALTEFGGYSLKLDGHLWNPEQEFGYKKFDDRQALTEAYLGLIEEQLIPWVKAGLSAAIYTQTTDVEGEVNGYLTYDREVEKMNFDRLREVHRKLWK